MHTGVRVVGSVLAVAQDGVEREIEATEMEGLELQLEQRAPGGGQETLQALNALIIWCALNVLSIGREET